MSYRDERDALEGRRAALETELRSLENQAAELASVAEKLRETRETLDEVHRRMQAGTPDAVRRLPLIELDQLQIASPCHARWDAMEGDDRVRFCGDCKLHVFNLSAMTRPEAEALVREREGRLCVRFYRRDDGSVLTRDCPVGQRKKRVRRAVLAVAGAGALAVAAVASLTRFSVRRERCAHRAATQGLELGQVLRAPEQAVQGGISMPPEMGEPMMGDIAPEPSAPPRVRTHLGRVRPTLHAPAAHDAPRGSTR